MSLPSFQFTDPTTGEPRRLPSKIVVCGFCRGRAGVTTGVDCTRCDNTGRRAVPDMKHCSGADVKAYNAQRGKGPKYSRRRRTRREQQQHAEAL